VLSDVSFDLFPGDAIAVTGEGKSVLLELIAGCHAPTAGSVRLFGHESFSAPASVKGLVGYASQYPEFAGQFTAGQNLAVVASWYTRWDDALVHDLARDWKIDMHAPVMLLSEADRQKLAVLSALGHLPRVLLLDEPFAAL